MADYRLNAGIVVFNKQGKVLLCQRKDFPDAWQFPQGGIDEGETAAEAARRELKEETSLEGLKLIKTLEFGVRYDFPGKIAKKLTYNKKQYSGQEMYWSLFFFDGEDSDINLATAEPEFSAFKWVDFDNACKQIVEFKKQAYLTAKTEFSALIEDYVKHSKN